MGVLSARARAIRARLVEQAKDPIDMGDYKEQFREYQEIQNETLKIVIDLAEKVEAKENA